MSPEMNHHRNLLLVLLSKVHDMGFKDAFLVAFLNGERISPQEAIKLIKKNNKMIL